MWFQQWAHEPLKVYSVIVGMMVLSSFGFPVPEEVTLVSAGIIGYMSLQSPVTHEPKVQVEILALVCFFAVFLSDFLVFFLGRRLGGRVIRSRYFKRYQKRLDQVVSWVKRYGIWAAGVFRFTPGLRFPGHFSCGMLGLSWVKFVAVDGAAALLSVPTQVLLVAYYGEEVLYYFKQFKFVILGGLVVFGIYYFVKMYREKQRKNLA